MADQWTKIADELERLFEDGDSIHLSEHLRSWENKEERKKAESQLKKQEAEGQSTCDLRV